MEKKKTILIAIFINAGLLAVLFVAALTMQDSSSFSEDVENPFSENKEKSKPLYSEFSDSLAVTTPPKQDTAPLPALQLPLSPPPAKEEVVVHHLPPLVENKLPVVSPVKKETSSFNEIKVKKGDNLEKIAKASHVTVREIIQLNNLSGTVLKIGQVLKLPQGRDGKKTQNSKPSLLEKGMQLPDYYTVKVGDNPWTIAMKHHMKVEDLLRINSLNEAKARKLKPGDRLRIR